MADKFKNNVTTSMIQLFDNNKMQLRLSGLDSSLMLALWVPDVDPVTGKTTYPKDKRFDTLLGIDNVASLAKMLDDVIIPAYLENKPAKISLFTNRNRDKILEIGVNETGDTIYLVFHVSVDPATMISSQSYVYTFSKTVYSDNYAPSTGEFDVKTCEGNFYVFASVVQNFIHAGGAAVNAHGFRKGNEYTVAQLFNYLKGIANKLGVTVENTYKTPSIPNNEANVSTSTQNNVPIEVTTLDNIPF